MLQHTVLCHFEGMEDFNVTKLVFRWLRLLVNQSGAEFEALAVVWKTPNAAMLVLNTIKFIIFMMN
ncbi:hypothetical protein ACWF7H_25845 [Peribacillus butanolivorans]